MVNLESSQAQWANECCRGGNCPICNPPEDDDYPAEEEDRDMEDYYENKGK